VIMELKLLLYGSVIDYDG